ncbi:hypothetical protein FTX61_04200 [Nitriliruptoraceae bacterium ZYF776]|nr:hypothetical protein [Profundirhabdus halotolerans]
MEAETRLAALVERVERALPETELRVAGHLGLLADRLDDIEGRLERLDGELRALRSDGAERWAEVQDAVARLGATTSIDDGADRAEGGIGDPDA